MPQNPEATRYTIKEGMFISDMNKNYIFMYKIHYDGNIKTLRKYCKQPNVSWSMFIKKLKGKPEPIWQFHCFSRETMSELYPYMDSAEDSDKIS